mgnify:CR=1 FL=1
MTRPAIRQGARARHGRAASFRPRRAEVWAAHALRDGRLPSHQIAEPIRFVGTSDRNFYDRYYFNLHASSGELFMVMGLGQYPNLAVQDAFACVTRNGRHHVVRASRELGDRMDTTVGPFRVEVIEGLKRLRFVLEPSGAPDRLRPGLDGRDRGVPRAAAVRAEARPRPLRHHAPRPDRAAGRARSPSTARRSP